MNFCDFAGEGGLVERYGAEMMQAMEVQGGGGCLAVGFDAVFVVPGEEGLVAGFTELESRVESGLDARGAP